MDSIPQIHLNNKKFGVCFVSSYPPRECGMATFTVSLIKALKRKLKEFSYKIVAIEEEGKNNEYSQKVIKIIHQNKKEDYIRAAHLINNDPTIDIVSLQHVFSLFGGKDGSLILEFLKRLKKPCFTTMHMVYSTDKKPHEFEVVETNYIDITKEIVKYSKKITVMIQPVADLLTSKYGIKKNKIAVIPHGLPKVKKQDSSKYKDKLGFSQDKKIISTFGLIRDKKGLEYVLHAMPAILAKYPEAIYLILGEAHPSRPRKYYNFLKKEVKRLKLEKNIIFHENYLTYKEIIRYLLASDIFITPYLVPEQTSSGVVAYALGCGKAIISTKFVYAKEVLDDGRGILIDFKNHDQISEQVDYLFSHPKKKKMIERKAYSFGQKMIWSEVANKYLELFFNR